MSNLQKGIEREIDLFTEAILSDGGSIPEVSAAAFCKARKKLKYTAFEELSELVADSYYEEGADVVRYWKGKRVLGIDGSNIEMPWSESIEKRFGVFKERLDGKKVCMSRSLLVYDTLNHITLYGALGDMQESETSMLWDCIDKLPLYTNDILVFDRNYASHLLMFYLKQMGVSFCFRMKKEAWKQVRHFYNDGQHSTVITLEMPAYDKKTASDWGITLQKIKCRLIRIELDNGETEILLTDLLDKQQYSNKDMKELYNYRWSIEELYKTFKHKVCIENFSGKSLQAVLQDFYIKIFIMNLTAVAIQPINEALKKQPVKVKYKHQASIIGAISRLKKAVVSFFLTNNIGKAVSKLLEDIAKRTLPIRPGRKRMRHAQPKRRYHMNYKPT